MFPRERGSAECLLGLPISYIGCRWVRSELWAPRAVGSQCTRPVFARVRETAGNQPLEPQRFPTWLL